MDTLIVKQYLDHVWTTCRTLLGSLGLMLLVLSCSGGGDNGTLGQGAPPSARSEEQAITQVLALYRTAMLEEDIDRLAELLPPGSAVAQSRALLQQEEQRQGTARGLSDAPTFLADISAAFRTRTVTALDQEAIEIAADRHSVSFLEVESEINPATLEQQTRLIRTTLQLRRDEADGLITFRIGAVQHTLLATVTTPGQVQAGALTRVQVTGLDAGLALAGVEVTVPETGLSQSLAAQAQGGSLRGLFIPPVRPDPQPLHVRLQGGQGNVLVFSHRYRLRMPGEGVVQKLAGTGTAHFFSVAIGPDSTVWGGGLEPPRGGGTLYQVPPGATMARLVGDVLEDPAGRVEDLTFDHLGRLHAIVRSTGSATFAANNRDVVHDRGIFCSTVNVFDPAQNYPLLVQDPRNGNMVPSPSTRVIAAGGGDVWLGGSDGGVARVADTFREGVCSAGGVAVRYAPVFRRENSALPTNSVPALVVGTDGALWFGTALGLTRFRDGQFTPVPFNRTLALSENVATLEQFFQAVAEAIFAARPLTTVAVGTVSFIEAFGRALVKEDLIFSAVEDARGRLWVGTLGGGLRRIEAHGGTFRDTLHLTRAEVARIDLETGARTVVASPGIGSNIIFALAVSLDGTIWAATEEGATRIQERDGAIVVTNFSALDGLALPVRDVAIDGLGSAWLATDGGLFRIVPAGGTVQGVVRDTGGRALVDADVVVRGTPFRAVTDATGRFAFTNLPPGRHTLQFDSTLIAGGPLVPFRTVDVSATTQMLEVTVVPLAPRVPVDPVQGGALTFPNAAGARLDIPPQALRLPAGEGSAIGLTPLPLDSLPLPLPAGFTVAAAVDLQPSGTMLTSPALLTLPNTAQLPAGRLVALLLLNEAVPAYEEVGRGRVSDDGTVITTISGGLTHFSAVVFASTAITAAATLVAVAGDRQTGIIGESIPQPLVVAVQDGAEQGVPGVPVTFTVTAGQGMVTPATALTDAQGHATAVLTLGLQVGENQVTVTTPGVLGSPLRLTATGAASSAARLVRVAGDGQSGVVGMLLPDPLVVAATDAHGNPIPDLLVTFTVTAGQGSLMPSQSIRTDAQGQAVAHLTLGQGAGSNMVTVTAPDLTPATFTATGVPGPATKLTVQGSSTVVVNMSVALVVQLLDAFDNPVAMAGVSVQLRTLMGNGALSSTQVTTNAQGQAAFTLTAGTSAGTNQLEASATGLGTMSFSVTGTADRSSSRLIEVRGNNQMGMQGEELPLPLVVRLVDQFQNPLAGEEVTAIVIRGAAEFVSSTTLRTNVPGATALRRQVSTVNTEVMATINRAAEALPQAALRTDEGGEVAFRLQVSADAQASVFVQVAALTAEPVQFVARVGFDLGLPGDIAVQANGFLVVIDKLLRPDGAVVVQVDPVTGTSSVVPEVGRGTNPLFGTPEAIAIDETNGASLVVVEVFPTAVVRVDAAAGQRTVITDDSTGVGPPLPFPQAIAVESQGTLLVVDAMLAAVVRIDPDSGDRTVVSGCQEPLAPCPLELLVGSGMPFAFPKAIAISATGTLWVVDAFLAAVVQVDPITGERTIVSDAVTGTGPAFFFPQAVALETNGTLAVADAFLKAVVRVEPQSGDRTVVSGCQMLDFVTNLCVEGTLVGSGPLFGFAEAIAVRGPGPLWVVDQELPIVVRVDPMSGKRFIVHFLGP